MARLAFLALEAIDEETGTTLETGVVLNAGGFASVEVKEDGTVIITDRRGAASIWHTDGTVTGPAGVAFDETGVNEPYAASYPES